MNQNKEFTTLPSWVFLFTLFQPAPYSNPARMSMTCGDIKTEGCG